MCAEGIRLARVGGCTNVGEVALEVTWTFGSKSDAALVGHGVVRDLESTGYEDPLVEPRWSASIRVAELGDGPTAY